MRDSNEIFGSGCLSDLSQKCGYIILSPSVILPNMIVQEVLINDFKNPAFCNCEENEKVIKNPRADPDHHQKLIMPKGSVIAVSAKFGRRPFPCLSFILFTEGQMERSHCDNIASCCIKHF